MRTLRLVLVAALLGVAPGFAQVHSVSVYGDYSASLSQRLNIDNAKAYGGGAELRLRVSDWLLVTLGAGYQHYSIVQDSAVEKWNWRFWNERYKGVVQDNLKSDTSLSATFTPDQRMGAYPVLVGVLAEFEPLNDFFVRPSLSGGIMFYTRKLYLEEKWQKRFASLGYVFDYSYYNFAPEKDGAPFVISGGLDVGYRLTQLLMVEARTRYLSVIETEGSHGFDDFPFKNSISVSLGISFLY